ncbi:transcription termination factor Rho [Caldisericum exile]|uniref:Transcription termination factor Rho n=1 Tax=Caldisericum exile (strain DSM 21853 / NBRC 104410 / AZM16c01) TaxID=511051 RepID=A0A7U6GEM2_CALEA|nr:transcription termination factor Rho [Caldisericum exile]BAL80987.1 putative transcription termination factor Rho [Caldisericum exile AZM16c01]
MDEILNLTENDLNAMTARELYKISQIVKLKNYSHYRKDELVKELYKQIQSLKQSSSNKRETAKEPTKETKTQTKRGTTEFQEQKTKEEKVEKQESLQEFLDTSKGTPETAYVRVDNEPQLYFKGLFEAHPDGYGFLRANYFPSFTDIYVSPPLIRKFGLRTGDVVSGPVQRPQKEGERYPALVNVDTINGIKVTGYLKRPIFENLTPYYPTERIILETPGCNIALRVIDLIAPLGKGQRGLIVSAPKAGKTTLMKEIAKSVVKNHPEIYLMILLIDERPEEVTDMKNSVAAEVVSSTFDQPPENHIRVVELALEKAKRLVEIGKDVMILLDGITRLTRAYNLLSSTSGKTLSGGLDPAAIRGPKKFLGAARSILNGGSLTILATALIDTGSKLDQVIYEEFKGTGNMEIVLDRELAEERIFPAIDIKKTGTRREELLYNEDEYRRILTLRKFIGSLEPGEALERLIEMLKQTRSNEELLRSIVPDER